MSAYHRVWSAITRSIRSDDATWLERPQKLIAVLPSNRPRVARALIAALSRCGAIRAWHRKTGCL
jgi:hypothetical protein